MEIRIDDCKYLTFTVDNYVQVMVFKSNFTGKCFTYVSDVHYGDDIRCGTPDQIVGWLEGTVGLVCPIRLRDRIDKFIKDEIKTKRNEKRKNEKIGD